MMDMLILIIICQLLRLIGGSSSTLEQLCKVKPQFGLCQRSENENQNKGPNRTWTRLRDLSKDEQQFVRLARESGDDPAVDFCLRYTERCPKEKIPEEPVPFQTEVRSDAK
ncbi:unnamed protein product [Strongylus vulgaris]|uniref:Uncharacterized protein n=1 Tax=Strongylus vulgaris TaxID=40348 RepID=A0A3P7K558_STRVU|nr:unnamed protein product [Strongylus vulgaris]